MNRTSSKIWFQESGLLWAKCIITVWLYMHAQVSYRDTRMSQVAAQYVTYIHTFIHSYIHISIHAYIHVYVIESVRFSYSPIFMKILNVYFQVNSTLYIVSTYS